MISGFFRRSSKDVFSLSFSRNRDSLDMWRGYGNNGGIAIGFDTLSCSGSLPGFAMMRKEQYESELKMYHDDPELMLPNHERLLFATNVIYGNGIDDIITEAIQIGLEHFDFMNESAKNIAMISAIQCITDTLFGLFPFIKNEGFKNEEECRIIENFVTGSNDIPLDVNYRERKGIALPFIKYVLLDRNCRPLKTWPITEIVISPGQRQKDLANSIQYFLNQQGMAKLAKKIVLSQIPFVN